MKIGFAVPSAYCLEGPGNGVRAQALFQAAALERRGHQVQLLNPWEANCQYGLDVFHFFQGGYGLFEIERKRRRVGCPFFFSPIIDSNVPNWQYRIAAALGSVHHKVATIPAVLRSHAQGSDVVVCRSTHERDRVVQGLGVSTERVRVEIVKNGVDPQLPADPELARKVYSLPKEYLLHVSAYTQSRKNVAALIEAVGSLGLPLVVAGTAEQGPVLEQIKMLANRHGNVLLLNFVPHELLTSLYAGCRVFCLPSIHEGTGLVALQAAQQRCGVVITKYGGPTDYFGDLAYYVDPANVTNIREKIASAWHDPKGDQLQKLVSEELTWDHSAARLSELYEAACSSTIEPFNDFRPRPCE